MQPPQHPQHRPQQQLPPSYAQMYAQPSQPPTHFSAFTPSPRGTVLPMPSQPPSSPHSHGNPSINTNQQSTPRFIQYPGPGMSQGLPLPQGAGPNGIASARPGSGGGGDRNARSLANTPVSGSNGNPVTNTSSINPGSTGSRPGSSAGANTGNGQYGAYS